MWMWLLPKPRRGNSAFVPQLSVRTEGNEDILDVGMMKLGTKVSIALCLTVAIQTQQTGHERYVLGAKGCLDMILSLIIRSVKSMPRILVHKSIIDGCLWQAGLFCRSLRKIVISMHKMAHIPSD